LVQHTVVIYQGLIGKEVHLHL